MGVTNFSTTLLKKHITGLKTVCELGAQNLYHSDYPGAPYADVFYKKNGFETYGCIDLNGENNAMKINLSQQWVPSIKYELVTDFGTSEHVEHKSKFDWLAIYNCWRIKHELLTVGGVMINENPKTGNWPLHGYCYYTQEFYSKLAYLMGYNILEIGEHPAMGNDTDGWNIFCILKKTQDNKFISLTKFKLLDLRTS